MASSSGASSASFLQHFGDVFSDASGVFSESEGASDSGVFPPPPAPPGGPRRPTSQSSRSRRSAGVGSGQAASVRSARHSIPLWQRPPEGRWRGGACPKAPKFDGDIEKDPGCLRKWKKDIKLWRKRARFHLPPNELAMDLMQALEGRARRELENVDCDDFDVEDGIEKLIAVFEARNRLSSDSPLRSRSTRTSSASRARR